MKSDNIIFTAEKAARKAGEIILTAFRNVQIHQKASNNLVTEADLSAEKAIRKIILEAFPEHKILGEEEGGILDLHAENLWIVDPLDGTNNYAHGLTQFGVSIAYAEKGTVKTGCIFDPVHGELFTAKLGQGAYVNGNKIEASDRGIEEAIISTGFYYERGNMVKRTLNAIDYLFENNIRGIRRYGAACLDICSVAAGRLDAYFELKLGPWDFAAGLLIASEAGAICTDDSGNPMSLESATYIFANKKVLPYIVEAVSVK